MVPLEFQSCVPLPGHKRGLDYLQLNVYWKLGSDSPGGDRMPRTPGSGESVSYVTTTARDSSRTPICHWTGSSESTFESCVLSGPLGWGVPWSSETGSTLLPLSCHRLNLPLHPYGPSLPPPMFRQTPDWSGQTDFVRHPLYPSRPRGVIIIFDGPTSLTLTLLS